MSDATASATAIPREINLGLQKPVATPAYTRRFKSQAQNPEASAGTQATITLDTAQPGSFIDTLDSYLSFTLRLTNPSTTRGYNVSFSSCGAQGLIRAMRIYVQGVPIEEITEYNALAEWLHDLSGIPDYCDRSAKSRYLANTMNDDYFVYLPAGQTREIAIQLPLISGVLGTMADKMFPSMLVAPGNCYIQLDLATAQNALRIQEINVSNLTVGTGGCTGTGARIAPAFEIGSALAPSADLVSEVLDTSTVTASIVHVSAKQVLEDQPYDSPFVKGATFGGATRVGVLTTEERIGGGIFGASGAQPTSTDKYFVGNKATVGAASAEGNTTALTVANTTASQGTSSVFLGAGLASGGTMAAGDRKMNVDSIGVTYTIANLEYIGKQVVVGDDVARAIIERAAAGDISIHTQSYRQYPYTITLTNGWNYRTNPMMVTAGANAAALQPTPGNPLVNMYERYTSPGAQSIIIPAKISSANAIYHIFRNGNGIDGTDALQFDSLRRMTIGFRDGPGGGTSVNAQLRIGNELIPQSPIQTASEALEELLKAHHMDGFYGTCEKMGSIVASSNQHEWQKPYSLLLTRGAGSALAGTDVSQISRTTTSAVDNAIDVQVGGLQYLRNDFNSQILCPNPDATTFVYPNFTNYNIAAGAGDGFTFLNPLGYAAGNLATDGAYHFYRNTSSSIVGASSHLYSQLPTITATTIYPESPLEYADRQARWKLAVRKAFFGYADERSNHQLVDPRKSNFMNPYKQHTGRYSTFMMGFDLDTFSHNSETIRSGHYLGNNTVSLNLSNCEFVDNSPLNQALCTNVRMDTYVLHDLRLSFQAGGIVQAFY